MINRDLSCSRLVLGFVSFCGELTVQGKAGPVVIAGSAMNIAGSFVHESFVAFEARNEVPSSSVQSDIGRIGYIKPG